MQRGHLLALLEHPDRDDNNFHLALAGVVRSMLCDADWPTLLVLARELAIDLRVWGPYPLNARERKPPTFAFNALVASAQPAWEGHEMSAEEYLDAPIGAVATSSSPNESAKSTCFSAPQIITWAAKTDGAAHYDPKQNSTFQGIGSSFVSMGSVTMIGATESTPITATDNLLVRTALLQISQWVAEISNTVLLRYEEGAGV
jgi:hypothetical protein